MQYSNSTHQQNHKQQFTYETFTRDFIEVFININIDDDSWVARVSKIEDPMNGIKFARRARTRFLQSILSRMEKAIRKQMFYDSSACDGFKHVGDRRFIVYGTEIVNRRKWPRLCVGIFMKSLRWSINSSWDCKSRECPGRTEIIAFGCSCPQNPVTNWMICHQSIWLKPLYRSEGKFQYINKITVAVNSWILKWLDWEHK